MTSQFVEQLDGEFIHLDVPGNLQLHPDPLY
jgi:hypothetical protein